MKKILVGSLIALMLTSTAFAGQNVNIMPNDGITVTGQTTVAAAGTAVAVGKGAIKSVVIKAKAGNGGNIFVGISTVDSADGYILDAGEWISMDVADLSDVYIDTDNNGDGVSYLATK